MNDKIILTYEITGSNNIPIKRKYSLREIETGILMDHFKTNRKVKFISLSKEEKQ